MVAQADLRIMVVAASPVEREDRRSPIEACPSNRVVACGADGRSALALAAEARPDVAVIDYSLPDTTALGLCHFLSIKHPTVQTLLHTAHIKKDWVVEAVREGVRAFVLKAEADRHLLPALAALADHRPYWEGAVGDDLLDPLLARAPRPSPNSLTSREYQVLQLVVEGHTVKEMADALGISAKTIESLRTSMRRKLGLRSVADLLRYAVEHDIVLA